MFSCCFIHRQSSSDYDSVTALHNDLTEVERDLNLRKLLWESMDEWELLVDQWKATPFEALIVDDVHRDVTRFVQTVFLLEKGIYSRMVLHQVSQK